VVFIPDYRVSLAEKIIPAADVSEQISTAGMEASGTGNMKFAMNGALTIGTLDGANIEIRDEVGPDNIFIFGLTAPSIEQIRATGSYDPQEYYSKHDSLRKVVDAVGSDLFCSREPGLFRWIADGLKNRDEFFVAADFVSYVETQALISSEYLQPEVWWRKAILNVARMGRFSSDRTVSEYAHEIWRIGPAAERTALQPAASNREL
jgi:glycogen phosphorylase